MGLVLLILLILFLVGGFAISVHLLWILALIALVLFVFGGRGGRYSGGGWYRW
jgi:hypothetical protein